MRPTFSTPLTRLGALSVGDFMRSYWQKRPVLLRQALPQLLPSLSRDSLLALAARNDVESRLVTAFNGRWRLRQGPFRPDDLPALSRKHWTLLVQGVDQHDPAAHALLSRFRFVSDARLDDLMVSYATDGGGVGPHIDSYDVFLIQAQGRRRWRISRQCDRALVTGLPVKILADFVPTHEWVLEPGDVLYLPPGVAHEGVALDECITCSVGFRAPRWQELVAPWHAWLEESTRIPGAYRDPGLQPTRTPARLPMTMVDASFRILVQRTPKRSDAEAMLLSLLSEPKPSVVFTPPARRLPPREFALSARQHGIALDLRTRLLYSRRRGAVNGELLPVPITAELRRLADHRMIMGRDAIRLVESQGNLLYEWYVCGWLHLLRAQSQSDA